MSLPNDAREWWSFLSLIAVRIFVDLKALNECYEGNSPPS